MASVLALAVLLIAATANATPNRIVGGSPTTIEQYPSLAQIELLDIPSGSWRFYCGGNILTSRWILSAANCFVERLGVVPAANRRVRVGTTFLNTGGQVIQIVRFLNHPTFGAPGSIEFDGDINISQLETPLIWSPTVQQCSIPAQGLQVPDNAPVVHAGWGSTWYAGGPTYQVADVQVFTINNRLCRDLYQQDPRRYEVTENMICSGILDVGGRNFCRGDAGGPMYYGNIVVGVMSWGVDCSDPRNPGVSTEVSRYTNWILANAV